MCALGRNTLQNATESASQTRDPRFRIHLGLYIDRHHLYIRNIYEITTLH
jgi:hypothetical protein